MEDLQTIEAQVRDLAGQIDAPAIYLPTFGYSEDGARPFVQIDSAYHYVVEERGQEIRRNSTNDPDELLYWIFDDIASAIASDWELKNRREDEDFRIQWFTKRMELLRGLSPAWEQRWKNDHWQLLGSLGMRPEERITQTPQ